MAEDIAVHPYWVEFKELALRAGIRSCWSEPILTSDSQVLGTFAIYHREPSGPDETELKVIKFLSDSTMLAIERKRSEEELKEYRQQLEERIEERTHQLQVTNKQLEGEIKERQEAQDKLTRSFENLQEALNGAVTALASLAEMRDLYTAGHQRRVAVLAVAIAREMGLAEEQVDGIRIAATIHDVGKIAVPSEILTKPSKLSDYEFGIIKAHPQIAYNILKDLKFPWPVAQFILQHHERLDGSGYPQGLLGKDIAIEAKILAVADTVEAMATNRPYRPALGSDKALLEILQQKDILYDSSVVDACLGLFTQKNFKFE
ncbi:MAG: HD domain-containing phosphohydrolase [Chloroflexota bacterium]